MICYLIKYFKVLPRNFFLKINTFRKVVRYINTLPKSVPFVNINSKHTEKDIRETVIHNSLKQTKQKQLGIKLTKNGGPLQRKALINL